MAHPPGPPDFVATPLPLLAVACVSAALLAYVARRWILLALVIALPSWLELLSWLSWTSLFDRDGPPFDREALQFLAVMMADSLRLPVAALAGAALAALVRRLRRR
jgi:hypothetical protein